MTGFDEPTHAWLVQAGFEPGFRGSRSTRFWRAPSPSLGVEDGRGRGFGFEDTSQVAEALQDLCTTAPEDLPLVLVHLQHGRDPFGLAHDGTWGLDVLELFRMLVEGRLEGRLL